MRAPEDDGYVRIDRDILAEVLAALIEPLQPGTPWPEAAVAAAITMFRSDAERACRPTPFPSRAEICRRTGWTDKPMRRMLAIWGPA